MNQPRVGNKERKDKYYRYYSIATKSELSLKTHTQVHSRHARWKENKSEQKHISHSTTRAQHK